MESRHFKSIIVMMLNTLASIFTGIIYQFLYSSRLKYSICNSEHHLIMMEIWNKCIPYDILHVWGKQEKHTYLYKEYGEKIWKLQKICKTRVYCRLQRKIMYKWKVGEYHNSTINVHKDTNTKDFNAMYIRICRCCVVSLLS